MTPEQNATYETLTEADWRMLVGVRRMNWINRGRGVPDFAQLEALSERGLLYKKPLGGEGTEVFEFRVSQTGHAALLEHYPPVKVLEYSIGENDDLKRFQDEASELSYVGYVLGGYAAATSAMSLYGHSHGIVSAIFIMGAD